MTIKLIIKILNKEQPIFPNGKENFSYLKDLIKNKLQVNNIYKN